MNSAHSLSQPTQENRVPSDELRVSLTRIIFAWGFGSISATTLSGAVYTAWVRQLSTNDVLFGALAAVLPFMSFLQVIAARRIQKHRKRKRHMIVNHFVGRSLWLVATLAPLSAIYYPQTFSRAAVFNVVLICIAAAGVFQAFAGPAFFSWMADLIPERVRPTFFTRRLQVGTIAAIIAALVGGLVADYFPSQEVLCWILALAALAGLVDILSFIGVAEAPMPQRVDEAGTEVAEPPFWEAIREPLQDGAVRTFLLFVSLTMAGFGLLGPFLWLHAMENLSFSKTLAGLVVNVAPLLGMAWSLHFWRGIIKSYGTRPAMRLCAIGLIFVIPPWIFAGRGEWMALTAATFLSGTMSGAFELTNQTLLTGIAPRFPRPTLIALFSIAAGVSFALASIVGGALSQFMRGYEWQIGGFVIVNFHVLFLASMLLRVVTAFCVAPRLQEPESTPTLETLKDVIPEMAQSLADLLTRPLAKNKQ